MNESPPTNNIDPVGPVTDTVPEFSAVSDQPLSSISAENLSLRQTDTPRGRRRLSVFIIAVLILGVGGGVVYSLRHSTPKPQVTVQSKLIRIGLSMDTLQELRWPQDRDAMLAEAQKKGANVTVLVANSDDATQVSQIENLISQKVAVIIVIPHNAAALSGAIADAHAAGIKIISYDRLLTNVDIDAYVTANSTTVGQLEARYVMAAVPASTQVTNVALIDGSPTDNNASLVHTGAMSVLQPLIDSGKIKLVMDQPITNWDPDLAQSTMTRYLAGGGKLDAAVVANDGMAAGVITALTKQGLAGKIPVSGQDADLPAVQRLVLGTQTVTMYKPVKVLGTKAVDIAIELATGKPVETTGMPTNNQKINVPTYEVEPIAVTKSNIQNVIIKNGWLTQNDIYGTAAPK